VVLGGVVSLFFPGADMHNDKVKMAYQGQRKWFAIFFWCLINYSGSEATLPIAM